MARQITEDFYTGFEGEPELIFIRRTSFGKEYIVRTWIGFFDQIMSCSEPEEYGWNGLARMYHLEEGWYDESPWKVGEPKDAVSEWQRIDVSRLDKQAKAVWSAINELMKEAVHSGDEVWIAYE